MLRKKFLISIMLIALLLCGTIAYANPTSVDIISPEQAVKQAIKENKIHHDKDKKGNQWFCVEDRKTVATLSEGTFMHVSFCLIKSNDNQLSEKLNFEYSCNGHYWVKKYVIMTIDGKDQLLTPSSTSNNDGSVHFKFDLSKEILQAIAATNGGITLKWSDSYDSKKWRVKDYTIPEKFVHNIQLMYANENLLFPQSNK
jgi:hypothetical protein